MFLFYAFSALTLLVGQQEGHPVKNWSLTVSKIAIGFTFQVPAHPASPGQRAVKGVCVLCSVVV